MRYTFRAIDSKTPRPTDAGPLPIDSADIGRDRNMRSAAKGPCKGTKGAIRAATRTARDQDRGISFRGERFSSPYTCSARRPSPQDDPSHHGNAGIGQSPKMKRLPPPLPHGGSPFGAPTRPPWKEPPLRLCRVPSADPVPSRPRLREAAGSPFKMRRPIAAAHARCSKTVPKFIDRTAPPTGRCCLLSSLCVPSRRSAFRWLRPHASLGRAMRDKAQGGPMDSDARRRGPQPQGNEEAA